MAKILVIEDNPNNMYLCTFMLSKHNHQIIEATNGLDGIEKAKRELPDLIILDIQLPEMDGFTVARILKSEELTKGIPIVAVTSYAMVGDRERILAAGCEGYIEKPIQPENFIKMIESFLVRKSPHNNNNPHI
ncbi:MAG: response regulator [Chitinispirillaceae bacterium]|nr:response regulator [Chitinispirillaceae bacterium]